MSNVKSQKRRQLAISCILVRRDRLYSQKRNSGKAKARKIRGQIAELNNQLRFRGFQV